MLDYVTNHLHWILAIGWFLREAYPIVRGTNAANLEDRAVQLGVQVYHLATQLGWTAARAKDELDKLVAGAAARLHLQPEQLQDLAHEAERELGQRMLKDAFGQLGKAADDFKIEVKPL